MTRTSGSERIMRKPEYYSVLCASDGRAALQERAGKAEEIEWTPTPTL